MISIKPIQITATDSELFALGEDRVIYRLMGEDGDYRWEPMPLIVSKGLAGPAMQANGSRACDAPRLTDERWDPQKNVPFIAPESKEADGSVSCDVPLIHPEE